MPHIFWSKLGVHLPRHIRESQGRLEQGRVWNRGQQVLWAGSHPCTARDFLSWCCFLICERPKNPQCLGVQLLFLPYFICPLSYPVLSCTGRSLAHSQMGTGLLSGGRAGVCGPLWAFCTMCCNRPGSGDARTCMHVNVCVPKTRGPTAGGQWCSWAARALLC